jgi:hypothetical protein
MMRPSVLVVAVSMLAASGGLAYLHSTQDQPEEAAVGVSKPARASPSTRESTASATAQTAAAAASTEKQTPGSIDVSASAQPVATPENVAQWTQDTDSTDAHKRAAAIAALASAPKAQAMLVLKRVLETGEPNVDRHIALRSMYSIALRDGDSNSEVRDVIRGAIYHGDDEGVTQTAQSLLDDIEAELSDRSQVKAR